ncbi:hypothetical protein BBJ28_00002366 [Nothophytophthora sp. Chile5]|nr:hypothetical protein BBJ28_00002366 [Nothophytophthora sp. Chile5]
MGRALTHSENHLETEALLQGAKHKRNPVFTGTDFRAVRQSVVMCNGQLPDSPQFEYMRSLLLKSACTILPGNMYRPSAASATQHRPWERLYEMLQLRMGHVESRLLQQRALADDIGALLTSTAKSRKSMNRGVFVGLLGLEPEYDAASEFSAHEYSLLKQLRAEKLSTKKPWSQCAVALLKQLFEMIRTSALKKKKQVYFLVFDFAASACSSIAPKSQHFLQRRWESLKRSQNRNITKTAVKLDAELQQMTFITPSPPLRSADTASTGFELNAVARAVGGDGTVSSVEQHCTSNGNTDGGVGEYMAGVVGCAVEGGGVMGGGVTGVEVMSGDLVVGGVECGGVMGGVEDGGVMGDVADGVKAFLAESTGMMVFGHQRQIASASAATLPVLDTLSVLDNITRKQLLDKAVLIPARTKGKWNHLHADYLCTYPASNLSKNALRLRLIGRQRKRADLSLSMNGTEDVGTPVAVATESPQQKPHSRTSGRLLRATAAEPGSASAVLQASILSANTAR